MLNSCTIQGRLAADPQLRQTTSGKSVCSFRIACNRNFGKDLETGWLDCVAWGQTGEFVSKYFQKGAQILLQGSIQTSQYQDKNGNNRTAVEVVANQINFVPRTNGQGSASGAAGYAPAAPAAPAAGGYSRPAVQDAAPSYSAGSSEDFAVIDDNEDLPF